MRVSSRPWSCRCKDHVSSTARRFWQASPEACAESGHQQIAARHLAARQASRVQQQHAWLCWLCTEVCGRCVHVRTCRAGRGCCRWSPHPGWTAAPPQGPQTRGCCPVCQGCHGPPARIPSHWLELCPCQLLQTGCRHSRPCRLQGPILPLHAWLLWTQRTDRSHRTHALVLTCASGGRLGAAQVS